MTDPQKLSSFARPLLQVQSHGYKDPMTATCPADTPYLIPAGSSGAGTSKYKTAAACLRLFAWTYVDPQPETAKSGAAQALGSILHAGLAHLHARRAAALPGGFALQGRVFTDPERIAAPDVAMVDTYQQLSGDIQQARVIFRAYEEQFRVDTWKLLHVEEVWRFDFDGVPLSFRVDLVYRDPRTGKVFIMDHKTASTPALAGKLIDYGMDLQIVGLRWLGQRLWGADFGGVVINLIATTASASGVYAHARGLVDPAPRLVQDFPQTVVDTAARIRAMEGRAPSDWTPAANELICHHRYGRCPCLERCKWGVA